jgi:hypothetical protein
MTLHKITQSHTQWFSVCQNTTSKFQTTANFKSSVKENNDLNKAFRFVHDISQHNTSFAQVQWFICCLYKLKSEF